MAKVAVVTDSTGCIPVDLIKPYPITVVPQVLIWGSETYQDGVDIKPTEFYQRLATASVMPGSSQVSPGTFEIIFRDLLAKDYHILAVLISHKLSGTIASAIQAKQTIGQHAPIEIFDSLTTAMAMGFQVLEAGKAAAQGASLAECKTLVESARPRCGVFLTVETLEFLHRGGRIGGATRFLGTLLNFKPILKLEDGKIEAVERVRTRKKALARVLELVAAEVGDRPVHLSALNANAAEEAQELLDTAQGQMNVIERYISDVSPVIGTHVGPGTVGMVYMKD
jgi:DegV family protein with EDD domain